MDIVLIPSDVGDVRVTQIDILSCLDECHSEVGYSDPRLMGVREEGTRCGRLSTSIIADCGWYSPRYRDTRWVTPGLTSISRNLKVTTMIEFYAPDSQYMPSHQMLIAFTLRTFLHS
jgi:hypothetical protein